MSRALDVLGYLAACCNIAVAAALIGSAVLAFFCALCLYGAGVVLIEAAARMRGVTRAS